jgi:predicted nucleic acid-binding protein
MALPVSEENGIGMYLIDTNILIYFFDGRMTATQKDRTHDILQESFKISVITKIEFLGFKQYMNTIEFLKAQAFLAHATVLQLTDAVIDGTISLRQAYKIKLADAIIAATALDAGLTLVTRNTADFVNLAVTCLNPFAVS